MKEVALGELCDIRSGGTPSRSNTEFYGGKIPWAKISDIEAADGTLVSTEETITDEGLAAIRGRLFEVGTLLFAIYGSIGKMAFVGRPLATNQAILGIWNERPEVLHSRYMFRYLESRRGELLADGAGIAQKNLSAGYVRDLKIPLPSLEEQRRIAGILDQADTLRRLRTRALDRLNTLGQAIFYAMFGDVSTNTKGLPKARVGDHCERVSVGVVIQPASYYVDDGVPAIRGTNIKPHGLDLKDLVFFSEEASNGPLKKSRIATGDVLAVRSGRPGLATVVPEDLDGANCIDVLIATTKRSTMLPEYLRDFLNSPDGRALVLSNSVGQVQQHFNVKSLSDAEIPLPNITDQLEYLGRITEVQEQRRILLENISKTESLFTSLQHRAFQGEL